MSADRPASTRPGEVTALAIADMLHRRGVGLLGISQDTSLVEAINDVAREHGIRLGRIEPDFDAIRAELKRLIDAAIRDPLDPPHLGCVSEQSRTLAQRLARNRLKAAE